MSTMNLSIQPYIREIEEVVAARNIVARTKKVRKWSAIRPLQGPRRALFGIPAVLPLFPRVSIYTSDYEGDGFR